MSFLLSLKNGIPRMKIPLGQSGTIGRSSECEIQLMDPRLSRKHARIYKSDEGWFIEDLGSQNGTFLDGSRIENAQSIADGNEVRIGEHVFIFNPAMDVLHERLGDKTVFVIKEDAPPQSDEQELTTPGLDLDTQSLLEIHRLTCQVMAGLDLNKLLGNLLDGFIEFFGANRGFILMRDSSGMFRPLVIRTEHKSLAISAALLNRVIENRRPVLVNNALEDVSFVGSRSIIEHDLRSVMLVPLISNDSVIGVIQLDAAKKDSFDIKSLAKLELLAQAAAIALDNAIVFEREKRKSKTPDQVEDTNFVGSAPQIKKLLATAKKAAASQARVLITGQSGTGKELIARMMHDMSDRRHGPWVAINCAAIPEQLLASELFGHEKGAFTGANRQKMGCFEQADGGTLFLDEIGEIPPSVQVKLLRALQESCFYRVGAERPIEVDVRVVAATNQNLKERIQQGAFREDLFFRLNVINLHIPPLLERREDIVLLARFFIEQFAAKMGKTAPTLGPGAASLLNDYGWPGNVRELQNVVERVMVLLDGDQIAPEDLPMELRISGSSGAAISRSGKLQEVLAIAEKELVEKALADSGGKKVAAAKMLGISRPTLDKKIKEYGLMT